MKTINLNRLNSLQRSIGFIETIQTTESIDVPEDLLTALQQYIDSKNNLNDLLKKYNIETLW